MLFVVRCTCNSESTAITGAVVRDYMKKERGEDKWLYLTTKSCS
jgi:hypothetical protein